MDVEKSKDNENLLTHQFGDIADRKGIHFSPSLNSKLRIINKLEFFFLSLDSPTFFFSYEHVHTSLEFFFLSFLLNFFTACQHEMCVPPEWTEPIKDINISEPVTKEPVRKYPFVLDPFQKV